MQLVPSVLILLRKHIKPSVVGLVASVFLQTLMYHLLWDPHAFLRYVHHGPLTCTLATATHTDIPT